MKPGNILATIVDLKRKDLAAAQARCPLAVMEQRALASPPPKFSLLRALSARPRHGLHLIAEVKKASPSKGILCRDFRPLALARDYEAAGAAAISVITEERFFLGSPRRLQRIAAQTGIPVLRKDFIVDPWQICETRALGASAFLLIVACLTPDRLRRLLQLGKGLGLEALVEVHTARETDIALEAGARLIGVNNRDLRTFRTDLRVSLDLRRRVSARIPLVSESGIASREDVRRLMDAGIEAALIGEAFVRHPRRVERTFRELLRD